MGSEQNEQRSLKSSAQAPLPCCLFFVLILVVFLPQESLGFQILSSTTTTSSSSSSSSSSSQPTSRHPHSRLSASIVDPMDIPAILTTAQHAMSSDLPMSSSLSAILASTIVAPSADAIAHLHGVATATAIPVAKAAATTAAASVQEMIPAGDAIQAQAKQALDSGWNVIDATKFIHGGEASFPGFSETKSIVAPHLLPGPSDESVTMTEWPQGMFKARIEYVSTILRAIQKLPYVAFGYVLLEFFFLRPNVDIYKEDVEDDPSGVLAETVSDAGVRAAIFFGLAIVTYVIA